MAKLTNAESKTLKKIIGDEPRVEASFTDGQMIGVYNWYNDLYVNDDAKDFFIEYIRKHDKANVAAYSKLPAYQLRSVGWNARILSVGGTLPPSYMERFEGKKRNLLDTSNHIRTEDVVSEVNDKGTTPEPTRNVQVYIRERASDLNGELEGAFDDLFSDELIDSFDATDFMRKNEVSAPVAKHIIAKFTPRYSEAFDVLNGKSEEKSAWKAPTQKKIVQFFRDIIVAAEKRIDVAKANRKPREKKIKPKHVVVAKAKYQAEDTELGIKSIPLTDVIGAQQLWVYNTKTRKIAVYHAIAPSGLSIKGTSIIGYDEKLSQTKTLRKPKEQLKPVIEGGKIILRRFMDGIRAKAAEPSPRLNTNSVLLRALK